MPKETTKNSLLMKRATQGTFAFAGILSVTLATLEISDYLLKKQVIDCEVDNPIYNQDHDQIEKCRSFIYAGKIALIGFDTKATDITYLVTGTQQKIEQLFGSEASIVSIPPSTALTEEYEGLREITSDGQACVSNKHFLSDTAREMMPDELQDYNVVIAYTSLPGCEDTYAEYPTKFYGTASYSSRSGDITAFAIEKNPEDIEMLVHEIGHSFGLHHTGSAEINFSPVIIAKERYNEIAVSSKLSSATYDEYGENSTIMGSGYMKNNFPNTTLDYLYILNTLQQQQINKITNKPTLQEAFIILDGSIAVSAPYNQITTIELAKSFTLNDNTTDKIHEYPTIAVVPSSDAHPGIKEKNRLEIYGQNGSLTVFLGYVTTTTYNKTVLHFDGQDITVEATDKDVRIVSRTV